uniref:Uncharacterized protein n=1 Tax=Arundo donax TaxID=35708 RepID=A0A0A9FSJ8_ARUDO
MVIWWLVLQSCVL